MYQRLSNVCGQLLQYLFVKPYTNRRKRIVLGNLRIDVRFTQVVRRGRHDPSIKASTHLESKGYLSSVMGGQEVLNGTQPERRMSRFHTASVSFDQRGFLCACGAKYGGKCSMLQESPEYKTSPDSSNPESIMNIQA